MPIRMESSTDRDIHCHEERPPSCGVVIFGASGDLAMRKLIPSLFALHQKKHLPTSFFLLGFARTDMDDRSFRQRLQSKLRESVPEESAAIDEFSELCHYISGDYQDAGSYQRLRERISQLRADHGTDDKLLFYLSVPPVLYQSVVDHLSDQQLTSENTAAEQWRRVVFEKPFGHDLASSRDLEQALTRRLEESQIYRIDHYLGKETVQNIMMLRFANLVFEPLWNRRYVDHVQITVAEDIGIGHRAGYYDQTGLLRDMFQNHLLQIMALIAMEPPASFAADHVRDEKVKVLSSVHPLTAEELPERAVRGQYTGGTVNGERVPGYREEKGVAEGSVAETYAALKLFVENWRWKGVPFYLRSGKRLAARTTEVAIVFKAVPHSIFHPLEAEDLAVNILRLNIQPREGVALGIQAKRPGPKMCLGQLALSFKYQEVFEPVAIDAYGRLLLDAMLGDQTLFIRSDNIDIAWRLLTPIIEDWDAGQDSRNPLQFYQAGGQGPEAAAKIIERDQRHWLPLGHGE